MLPRWTRHTGSKANTPPQRGLHRDHRQTLLSDRRQKKNRKLHNCLGTKTDPPPQPHEHVRRQTRPPRFSLPPVSPAAAARAPRRESDTNNVGTAPAGIYPPWWMPRPPTPRAMHPYPNGAEKKRHVLLGGSIRSSLCLTFNSGPLGMDCTTSLISGMRCTSRLSSPIFMVMVLEGQLPQAPSSSRRTTGPSISTTRTFPLMTGGKARGRDRGR